MSTRFGEFLMEAGVIDAGALLSALAEQHRRREFLPNLAVRLGYITNGMALELLDHAANCYESFLVEAQDNGILNKLTARDVLRNGVALHYRWE